MTGPAPYPGDLPRTSASAPTSGAQLLRREYKDSLGRPLVGVVKIRRDGAAAVDVALKDGVLTATLTPGTYNLLANLMTLEGGHTYKSEVVKL